MHRALHDERAKTIGAMARARDEQGDTHAERWLYDVAKSYRAAMMMELDGAQNIAVAYDASRLGSPLEETLMTVVIDVDTSRAGWLLPAVWSARESSVAQGSSEGILGS